MSFFCIFSFSIHKQKSLNTGCGNPGVTCAGLSKRKCRQYSGCHYDKYSRSCSAYRGGGLRCIDENEEEDSGQDDSEYYQYDDNYDTYQDDSVQDYSEYDYDSDYEPYQEDLGDDDWEYYPYEYEPYQDDPEYDPYEYDYWTR